MACSGTPLPFFIAQKLIIKFLTEHRTDKRKPKVKKYTDIFQMLSL
jgi:hypothetical protein